MPAGSPKKVQIPKAVKWIDNCSCCSEQLMQIPPSSWITFGTRQMVHPPNSDSTNFPRRFSQDTEHKWRDGKITLVHCLFLGLVYMVCLVCEAVTLPSTPMGIEFFPQCLECNDNYRTCIYGWLRGFYNYDMDRLRVQNNSFKWPLEYFSKCGL